MSLFAAIGVGAALLASLRLLPALIPFAPALPSRSTAYSRLARSGGSRRSRTSAASTTLRSDPRAPRGGDRADEVGVDRRHVGAGQFLRSLCATKVGACTSGSRAWIRVASRLVWRKTPRAPMRTQRSNRCTDRAFDRRGRTRSEAVALHSLLWSEELQRRNWELVAADSTLSRQTRRRIRRRGISIRRIRGISSRRSPNHAPSPLTVADFEASPLADLMAPFVFRLGDKTAVITYLRGLRSPEALRDRLEDDRRRLPARSGILR